VRNSQEKTMKNYEPSTPRTTLGLIAVALTALTIGLTVVLPAGVSRDIDNTDLAAAAAYSAAANEASALAVRYIEPVEVIGYRSRELTSNQSPATTRRGDAG